MLGDRPFQGQANVGELLGKAVEPLPLIVCRQVPGRGRGPLDEILGVPAPRSCLALLMQLLERVLSKRFEHLIPCSPELGRIGHDKGFGYEALQKRP